MIAWKDFVSKVYWENKKKNPNYQFKDALRDASERKSEMASLPAATGSKKSRKVRKSKGSKKSNGSKKSKGSKMSKKSRKNRSKTNKKH
jgi:hypothetical protein